jgi:hypothetical protein
MIDPNDDRKSQRKFAERAWKICKRVQRSHLDSFGKLGELNTWLRSLAVAVAFLLISYLFSH